MESRLSRAIRTFSEISNSILDKLHQSRFDFHKLAPHINVNTVAPGHTLTEMTAPLPDEIKRTMIEGSYLKRMAQPQDIANAILFLASDDANFITGQLLLVDGGFSLK